jgi:phage terminase large subunit
LTERKGISNVLKISGVPNKKQALFFASRAKYTAYGGARGGGKSWALRRKLIGLCLRYPTIRCLLIRRTYGEVKSNHLYPILSEYGRLVTYSESEKTLSLPNGSKIIFGYCASDRDLLRYQGQEYDIIAIDEATQLSEYQFSVFKACLRGCNDMPKRMYLTCNPGGVGHAWVKRLFVDRDFRADEDPLDYLFIQALVYDNEVLTRKDTGYVKQLESLPKRLRDAWLIGRWDVFEGQFFPEFKPSEHICDRSVITNRELRQFVAFDYGFDMTAALLMGADSEGNLYVIDEFCQSGLTLSRAAEEISKLCQGYSPEYAVASPDLWNRRQDSGKSGFEIMQVCPGMPPMRAADDRRVPGWRVLREYLSSKGDEGHPYIRIAEGCSELIRSLPALTFDSEKPEDASSHPHSVTHAPEALRYGVMSRIPPAVDPALIPDRNFRFGRKSSFSEYTSF